VMIAFKEDIVFASQDMEGYVRKSLELANYLRSQGIYTFVYPQLDKFKKQLPYANAQNIPFVCWVGDNEYFPVILKDFLTGDQKLTTKDGVVEEILLNRSRKETQLPGNVEFLKNLRNT
ncbi:MAG: His/Gly/Thr/Pro-type tRNA ligase C-terminal domain-containing protein, partial [Pyrinomonadaceae bacterium]